MHDLPGVIPVPLAQGRQPTMTQALPPPTPGPSPSHSPILQCALSPTSSAQPSPLGVAPSQTPYCRSSTGGRAGCGLALEWPWGPQRLPAPLPLSCCCAGLGPASSEERLTLQPTSPWTPAMTSRCARGRVSGWAKPQRAWNQQADFLTPAGNMETSIAAFASKFQVAGEGRCPSEDSAPLSRCSTHTQRHIFVEAACAILHGPVFQVASLGALLLFAPGKWGQYLPCPPPGLPGGPWCRARTAEHWEVAVGTREDRGIRGGGADPLPHLPPRSATGWWTGHGSTCAARHLCVAAPTAGTARAPCSLPMLGTVPRRVPCFPGETRPSAVGLLSRPAPSPGSFFQHLLGMAQWDPMALQQGRVPRRTSDLGSLLGLPSFRDVGTIGSGGVGRAAVAVPLTCMHLCAQLSCVLVARSTRSVPQCAVGTVGRLKAVGSWAAVWPVVIAPLGLLWDPEGQCVPPGSCPCQLGAHRYAPGSATMKGCNRW